MNTAEVPGVLLRVRKSLQILIAGLTILLGGVVVYWAEQYEQSRRLACVQVITPAEFLKEGVTIGQAGQSACLLSPALRSLTDSAGSLLVSLAPAALSEGPKWIDWLPVDSIRTILQPSDEALFQISAAQGRSMIRFGQGEVIPVHPLSGHAGKGTHRRVYVVLGTNGQSIAIPVDELVGQQLVLLRPLRGVMARMPNLTGTALLAGGEVGMVLSASSLLSSSEGMVLGMMGAAA